MKTLIYQFPFLPQKLKETFTNKIFLLSSGYVKEIQTIIRVA